MKSQRLFSNNGYKRYLSELKTQVIISSFDVVF